MASAKDQIVCHVCGFKNAPDAARCVSCGAKIEAVAVDYTAEEAAARENQQEGFSLTWVFVAFGIYLVLQAIFLVALPFVISAYDPIGVPGLAISIIVWFFGGIVVGFLSPGKTFLEPAAGACLACLPTIAYNHWVTPVGFQPTFMEASIMGIMGIMISLFGAFLGERVQARTRGHVPAKRK
jgi:hypothetical protein